MGYIENNRLPDEEIIVEAGHPGTAFIWPAALVALGVALSDYHFVWPIFLLVGIWKAAKVASAFSNDEMALTDKRIIGKSGLLKQKSVEVKKDSISGLSVDQSIPGRILGYGTVTVIGDGIAVSGEGDGLGFNYVGKPKELRNTVQSHLAETS